MSALGQEQTFAPVLGSCQKQVENRPCRSLPSWMQWSPTSPLPEYEMRANRTLKTDHLQAVFVRLLRAV